MCACEWIGTDSVLAKGENSWFQYNLLDKSKKIFDNVAYSDIPSSLSPDKTHMIFLEDGTISHKILDLGTGNIIATVNYSPPIEVRASKEV
jgi:hypothetical protein